MPVSRARSFSRSRCQDANRRADSAAAGAEIVARSVVQVAEAARRLEAGAHRRGAAGAGQALVAREADDAEIQRAAARERQRRAKHAVPLQTSLFGRGMQTSSAGFSAVMLSLTYGKSPRDENPCSPT